MLRFRMLASPLVLAFLSHVSAVASAQPVERDDSTHPAGFDARTPHSLAEGQEPGDADSGPRERQDNTTEDASTSSNEAQTAPSQADGAAGSTVAPEKAPAAPIPAQAPSPAPERPPTADPLPAERAPADASPPAAPAAEPTPTETTTVSVDQASPTAEQPPETSTKPVALPAEEEAESRPPSSYRKGFTVVPRLGFAAAGWTQFDTECEASGMLVCDEEESFGRREASGVSLALEGLYQILPSLRVGAVGSVIPSVRGDGGDVRERLGIEGGLSAIVEGVFDVTASMAIAIRGQIGGTMLWTRGLADDQIDRARDQCDEIRDAGFDCYVEYGPFVSPSYGVGAGFVWPVQSHRLRLDALYQISPRTLYRQEAESESSSADSTMTMDVQRFWLSLGFEI